MKINPSKPRRFLFISLVAIMFALFIFAGWRIRGRQNNVSVPSQVAHDSREFSGPTEAEKQEVEENKTRDGGLTQPNPLPSAHSDKSVKIIRTAFDASTQQVIVQSELHGPGWQQCNLELIQGSDKVTKTAEALYQPDFSTCLGFSVSSSELPAGGEWFIQLQVTNSDGKTYDASQTSVSVIK